MSSIVTITPRNSVSYIQNFDLYMSIYSSSAQRLLSISLTYQYYFSNVLLKIRILSRLTEQKQFKNWNNTSFIEYYQVESSFVNLKDSNLFTYILNIALNAIAILLLESISRLLEIDAISNQIKYFLPRSQAICLVIHRIRYRFCYVKALSLRLSIQKRSRLSFFYVNKIGELKSAKLKVINSLARFFSRYSLIFSSLKGDIKQRGQYII